MNILLIHAAFADASSWNKVIPALRAAGHEVIGAQIPLTSLNDDVAAVRREIARMNGPVLLAAHSYGGAVMTAAATGEEKVKGLVYIAAMGPDEGETVAALLHRAAAHPLAPALAPDGEGWIRMSAEGFANAVAPDAPEDPYVLSATQKAIHAAAIMEPMGAPGWKQKPSWYLLGEEDRIIAPETQRFMAERMGAVVQRAEMDHSPNLSAPSLVAGIILQAAEAVTAGS